MANNEINTKNNSGLVELSQEKAMVVLNKLYVTYKKADNTASIALASMILVAKKAKISNDVLINTFDLTKDTINMYNRGAKWLDSGNIGKNGLPILKKSPFAVGEKDFTPQKLSRLSAISDDVNVIKKFISDNNITPDTPQATLIKLIADYKKPKNTEATEATEASEASEASEKVDIEAAKPIVKTETFDDFETLIKLVKKCYDNSKDNKELWKVASDAITKAIVADRNLATEEVE